MIAFDKVSERIETENGWVLVRDNEPWTDLVKVYIGKKIDGKFKIGSLDKFGHIILKDHKEGENEEPILIMPYDLWRGFLSLFGEMPSKQKSEIDAELKATKFHLEDMRTLVFNKN